MSLGLDILSGLMVACAPLVAVETGVKLVRHESGGNPYAIGVNGPYVVRPQPSGPEQAAATAAALLRLPGVRSIDMGLGQINSANLPRLGLSLEQVFDPCHNLRAMQAILLASYRRWAAVHGPGEVALQKALSEYNTGSPTRGLANGYVYRIYMQPLR
jgi:type IV secretion system protein VirB1